MTESTTRAKAFFTYAAFGAVDGRPAGWRVGQCEGMTHEKAERLSNQVPSYLASEAPVPRYAGEQELKQLIHRGVWRSNPLDSNENLFIHSTPAGTDASGRPSNVFTTVYVFDAGIDLGMHPAQMLGSPSILVPFNKEVNNRRVESSKITANPEITPRSAFDHLMSATRRSFAHVRDIVATVLDGLSGDGKVIIGDDPDNAWAWIALVNFAMDRVSATRYGFSTYEREYTIGTGAVPDHGIYVMPREDLPKVTAATNRFDAIDVTRGVSRGELNGATRVSDDVDRDIPVTPISVLFTLVVSSPQAADVLLEEPVSGGAPTGKLAALAQRSPGDADEKVRQALAEVSMRRAPTGPGFPETGTPEPSPFGEPAPENPFSVPASPMNRYERAATSPAPQARPGRTAAEVREISTERIARIHGQLDQRQTGLVWTGDDYQGWPDLIEVLLALSVAEDALWQLQARLFATAAASLIQRSEGVREVDWLPWWKLEDDPELRNAVLEQLLGYSPVLSKGAVDQAGNLSKQVTSGELRMLLEKLQGQVTDGLQTARSPYTGLRGDGRQRPALAPNQPNKFRADRFLGSHRQDKE